MLTLQGATEQLETRISAAPSRRRRGAMTLLVAATLAALAGCDRGSKNNAYVPPPPPEVIIANPVERDVTGYISYTGVIAASETVDLRARVQGFLERVNFKPGQRVKKGDVLFVIDKRQYQARVEQARAAVGAQKAALVGAENDAKLARELADQRAGPEIDAVIKAARRDSLQAQVLLAQAELADAQLNLDYCDVTAPIDGRISRNFIDVGNLVGRGETTLLAQIVQATPAYVYVDVSESDVLSVRREREKAGEPKPEEPGQIGPGKWRPCELAFAGEKEFKVSGRVDYVDPQLNPETGTLRVRTRFENTDEGLVPGLFANIRFSMSTRKAMLVPDAALQSDQQGRFAIVVNEKDEAEVKRVKIGALDSGMRVVEEGLTANDRVIVLGVLKARPGAKVTPKAQEAAAQSR